MQTQPNHSPLDASPSPLESSPSRRRAASRQRAGFTLLELLAVFVIIGVLGAALYPTIKSSIAGGKVAACEQNLKRIGEGLTAYNVKYQDKGWPTESGVKFFASLITDGVWEPTAGNSKRLTCPAIAAKQLPPYFEYELELEDWFLRENKELINGDFSTYAGPDRSRTRLRKFPASGKTVLMADDNDGEANHDTATIALMGNLSTFRFELITEQDKGTVPVDATYIRVGPDSPVEALQNLTLVE